MATANNTAGTALVALGKRIDDFVARADRMMWNWSDPVAKVARLAELLEVEWINIPFKELETAVLGAEKTRMALFIAAPHHQGGHSRSGAAIADALGVPFPIDTKDLLAKAREEEINPALLWPWLVEMRPDLFTPIEIGGATKPKAEG